MERSSSSQVAQLLAACHRIAASGLVVGSAGNISTRIEDRVLITPAGADLAALTGDQIVELELATGVAQSPRTPTSEVDLHLGILRRYSDMVAVVHTHSRAAAAHAVARQDIPFICNESLAMRAGAIRVTAAYAPPGSAELARVAVDAFDREPGSRAILLANHGPVVVAETLSQAVTLAIQVEWAAEIHYRARMLGAPHVLDPGDQLAMARNYGSPYRPRIPAESDRP